jgi:hypothetical protein
VDDLIIETARHVLIDCPRWDELRDDIFGTDNSRRSQDIKKLLGDPVYAKPVTQFML